MNLKLLDPAVQNFIQNFSGDLHSLAFSGSPFDEVSTQELLQQISARKRIENKLPYWHQTENLLFPPQINIEQASSQITAKYKASLITGNTLADLTGGFGIDSYYFSQKVEEVNYFEVNRELFEYTAHNFKVLKASNIKAFSVDGISAIADKQYDVIYLDPDRRHDPKGKVFFLADCRPDLIKHLDYLLDRCGQLMVKTSPMLDITAAIKDLKHVTQVHVVAVINEVKELLWLLQKDYNGEIRYRSINFENGTNVQRIDHHPNLHGALTYGAPKSFLYEPNAAMMKLGMFADVAEMFNLQKLHPNSHLFTSEILVDFPGRSFKIETVVPYQKRMMKELQIHKANITIRNFPESVASIRKKWRIQDGGDHYIFFTTNFDDQKIVLICSRIS